MSVLGEKDLIHCPCCGGVCKKCSCTYKKTEHIVCTKCHGEFAWTANNFHINVMSFNKRVKVQS